jgi:hypothetical protein
MDCRKAVTRMRRRGGVVGPVGGGLDTEEEESGLGRQLGEACQAGAQFVGFRLQEFPVCSAEPDDRTQELQSLLAYGGERDQLAIGKV